MLNLVLTIRSFVDRNTRLLAAVWSPADDEAPLEAIGEVYDRFGYQRAHEDHADGAVVLQRWLPARPALRAEAGSHLHYPMGESARPRLSAAASAHPPESHCATSQA